eukprot:IDg23793t1
MSSIANISLHETAAPSGYASLVEGAETEASLVPLLASECVQNGGDLLNLATGDSTRPTESIVTDEQAHVSTSPINGTENVTQRPRNDRVRHKTALRCGYPGCKNKSVNENKTPCRIEACLKTVHPGCYSNLLLAAPIVQEEWNGSDGCCCSKRCLKKWRRQIEVSRQSDGTRKRVLWSQDGSLSVVLSWLTTEGNYERYVGGNSTIGRTKDSFHAEIKRLIADTEGCSERSEKDIGTKIASLERAFREASDWLNNTGAGLSNPGEIRAYIQNKWPHYYDLEPILADRPNTRPLYTNEENVSGGQGTKKIIDEVADGDHTNESNYTNPAIDGEIEADTDPRINL